jgi:hypothetical protein
MAPPDCYSMAAEVADALRLAGRRDFGQELEDVVAAGFTSSEVLMGVRHTLRRQMRDPQWPQAVTAEGDRLLEAINRALGGNFSDED